MKDNIGFAILGTGLVAPFHANAIKASTNGQLIGVCDVDKERAGKFASEYDAAVYTSLDEMLKDDRINVVNIATPNHLHYDAVMACCRAGKHIIVEKPPAMTLKETDEMIEACKAANLRFGCTVQSRVRKSIQAVKKAIDSGRFGKILNADAYMKWYRSSEYYHSDGWRSSRKSGAGVTVQHAFHYIDLLVYLVGPLANVQAQMKNLAHPSVKLEDTLLSFIEFKNGAQGVVQASTAFWPGTDIRIEINGENGTAIVLGEKIDKWSFKDELPEDEEIRNLGNAAQATGASGPAAFGFADHQVVVQDMIDAILNDHEVIIPVSSVRPTLEAVLAMYHSAAKNCKIELPVVDDESIWEL